MAIGLTDARAVEVGDKCGRCEWMDDKLLPSICQLMITTSRAGKDEDEDDEEEEDGEMEDGKDDEEDEEDEDGDEDIDISKKFGFLVSIAELSGNSFLSALLSPSPSPSTSPDFKEPKIYLPYLCDGRNCSAYCAQGSSTWLLSRKRALFHGFVTPGLLCANAEKEGIFSIGRPGWR